MQVVCSTLLLILLSTITTAACAQITQLAELTASDGAAGDEFGESVAVSGNIAVIGAPFAAGANGKPQTGAVYVFENSGSAWTQVAKLIAGNGSSGDQFGFSVAIAGSTIAVGAININADDGIVYVFVEPPSGWTDMKQTAQLKSDDMPGGSLGMSVAVSADETMVLTTAYRYGGAVFVEPTGGWVDADNPTATLEPPPRAYFFPSIAASSNTVFVPSYEFNENGGGIAVYQLRPGMKKLTSIAALTGSDPTCDGLGQSVAVNGNTIAAGSDAICVFVEPASGWTNMNQTAELTIPTSSDVAFGDSVAFMGASILGGAPFDDIGSNKEQGAFFGYQKPASGWVNSSAPTLTRTSSDGEANDWFGYSMSASGTNIVVGAMFHVNSNASEGAAYIFGPKP